MSATEPLPAKSTRAVWIALFGVSVLKLAWAATSAGSVDAVLFFNFARALEEHGLCGVYALDPKYNHTPLTGVFVRTLLRVAGGEFMVFSFLLRLAASVADVVVVAALLQWREKLPPVPTWGLVLLAASPVSLMVSGFHGNVDPLLVALLFLAAVAGAQERPALAGLLYGLSCQVKIVPLAFAPVFFFFWLARGRAWRFAWPAALTLLAGSALPLLEAPGPYLRNVFAYGSSWGVWGVPYLLKLTGWEAVQKIDFHGLGAEQRAIAQGLKCALLGSIALIGWVRRGTAARELPATLGMAWVAFFIFAPGVGVQYLTWFAPFVLLWCARRYALLTAGATVFLAVFYHTTAEGRFPWFLAVPRGPETPLWSAVGLPVWLLFVGLGLGALWAVRPGWRQWHSRCSVGSDGLAKSTVG